MMLRIPVRGGNLGKNPWIRLKSSSSFIRSTYIEYFKEKHGHKHVKSSSVVPLCDPTVPFVNAGMNQFKGVFLEQVDPPCPRAVNSQKCIRVGGKHNDLDVVGTDGTHHTFFEMLGNWSFGDYYKKEACQMAWDLLLGPYRLKPENLVVTYFAGDAIIGLQEDKECRDIWKDIGVPSSRLKALGAKDNFWEMGASGPCGPCTEIHHINADGSLTEIWNIVFIQCNRLTATTSKDFPRKAVECLGMDKHSVFADLRLQLWVSERQSDGTVEPLARRHVDTGLGLERLAALLQGAPSNYDTDLFRPIITAIEKNSKGVSPYGGSYSKDASVDCAYRRLADHARMVSVCLADGVFPAASLNLKQIMRKCFKLSKEVFQNPQLLTTLYSEVAATLGPTYPELIAKASDAKLIMEHEEHSYAKLRSQTLKKWKALAAAHPEVEALADVELAGFAQGYSELKEIMNKRKSTIIPGEVVFKLYDTHGFQEDLIQRIAKLNNLSIDKEGFSRLLTQHKSRHKTALKEQSSNRGLLFNQAIETLIKNGVKSTNDQPKYDYITIDDEITFEPLETKLVAILNDNCEWIDISDPCQNRPYYLVTEDTNFYCEEGGQMCDTGVIRLNENIAFNVDSVFKIRDFVFHKGTFTNVGDYVKCNSNVILEIDSDRRCRIMRNHTGVHLLNAAIRTVLPNSVVCQIGSGVSDRGLYLNLSVYGEKLSQDVVLKAQDLVRESIKANVPVATRVTDSVALTREESVLTVPGETYPESGLRLVAIPPPLPSKELCCGSHVNVTGQLRDFCITLVKGAGGHAPVVHALTGRAATEARELFCRAEKLSQVIHLVEPSRRRDEVSTMKRQLAALCGTSGAPYGEYGQCVALLDSLLKAPSAGGDLGDEALLAVANTEVQEAVAEAIRDGRHFVIHFLRCSYLMRACAVSRALAARPPVPVLLVGCAGGTVAAGCAVPQEMATEEFTAKQWLGCILPVFQADILPAGSGHSHTTYAEMAGAKVSLINCEQLVQDAMRAALHYAKKHARGAGGERPKNRQHN